MATAASQGGSEDSEGRGRRTMNPQSCVVAMVADANDDATWLAAWVEALDRKVAETLHSFPVPACLAVIAWSHFAACRWSSPGNNTRQCQWIVVFWFGSTFFFLTENKVTMRRSIVFHFDYVSFYLLFLLFLQDILLFIRLYSVSSLGDFFSFLSNHSTTVC